MYNIVMEVIMIPFNRHGKYFFKQLTAVFLNGMAFRKIFSAPVRHGIFNM
jgi:hypothetical protein